MVCRWDRDFGPESLAAPCAKSQDEIQALRTRISEGSLSLSEDKLAELQQELQDKSVALQRSGGVLDLDLDALETAAFRARTLDRLGQERPFDK